jgi:hypothetical protein
MHYIKKHIQCDKSWYFFGDLTVIVLELALQLDCFEFLFFFPLCTRQPSMEKYSCFSKKQRPFWQVLIPAEKDG